MTRLVRAEFLKLRTTKIWWLMGLGMLTATAFALLYNCIFAHIYLYQTIKEPAGLTAEQARQFRETMKANLNVPGQAASIYTSGQFFGLMLIMLLAIIMVTNEFFHQTATATFLTTPRRTMVITAKLITAVLVSVAFWLLALIPSLVTGAIYLSADGFAPHLGDWVVWQSILLNLAAFAIWAVFGIGVGVLIRSQIGAVVTGTVLYLVGTEAAALVFQLIRLFWIKHDWVLTAQVIVPSVASRIMISVIKYYPQSPAEWVGAVVLIGYAVVACVIGVMITRRRDIA